MGIRSVLEANFDFEIIDEFLDHYAMMTEIMEPLMVDLGNAERCHRSMKSCFVFFITSNRLRDICRLNR